MVVLFWTVLAHQKFSNVIRIFPPSLSLFVSMPNRTKKDGKAKYQCYFCARGDHFIAVLYSSKIYYVYICVFNPTLVHISYSFQQRRTFHILFKKRLEVFVWLYLHFFFKQSKIKLLEIVRSAWKYLYALAVPFSKGPFSYSSKFILRKHLKISVTF